MDLEDLDEPAAHRRTSSRDLSSLLSARGQTVVLLEAASAPSWSSEG
jgi:hypothetical protein